MNDARRKAITEAHAKLDEAKSLLETTRDEEQDYYDAMPESFQNGDKGEKAQSAIDALDEAINELESAMANLDTAGE
jgi:hypothetical protein